jgi:predicted transposase/invertase (TIGR01784 family)
MVDVRCRDQKGRQFIVEMQMQWTTAFLERVFFYSSRAYVSQLKRGQDYKLLQPVFGLSVINDIFEPGKPDFYHHYKMVNIKDINKEIKGLQLVFIELPKFEAALTGLNPDLVGWLRYL